MRIRQNNYMLIFILFFMQAHAKAEARKDPAEAQRRWEIATSMVQHQDQVISDRLGSFLTIQGFLFAAIGLLIQKRIYRTEFHISYTALAFFAAICAAGFTTAYLSYKNIHLCYEQKGKIALWWNEYFYGTDSTIEASGELAVIGSGKTDYPPVLFVSGNYVRTPIAMPLILSILWALFVIIIFIISISSINIRKIKQKTLSLDLGRRLSGAPCGDSTNDSPSDDVGAGQQ